MTDSNFEAMFNPTWFFTISAADMKWPDMIQTIAKQYGVLYTDEEVSALSFGPIG